jgi:CCR4-NOT transcriptional regulation complex NOT5 subunit
MALLVRRTRGKGMDAFRKRELLVKMKYQKELLTNRKEFVPKETEIQGRIMKLLP